MPAFVATSEQFKAMRDDPHTGPIVMVNLLKFKEKATYPDDAEEAEENLTGEQAYRRYMQGLVELSKQIGSEVIHSGTIGRFFIGEGDWDRILIVRYPSRAKFIEMVTSDHYKEVHRHREAGLLHQDLIETRP